MIKLSKIIFILFLASCAGEIDSGFVDPTKLGTDDIEPLEYSGVIEVNPISHNKLEVFFPVADGANVNLVYRIFINDNEIALQSNGTALELDPLGRYRVTLDSYGLRKDIEINTFYKVRVEVYDSIKDVGSESEKSIQIQTFNNETAEFNGITSANVMAGVSGLSSILVKWQFAEKYGTVITPHIKDVAQYEIKYISANLGYRNLNNDSVALEAGEKGLVLVSGDLNELQVSGLNPDTKYYFQVRAIHNGYGEFSNTIPNYRKDENTSMKIANTLTDASSISFLSSSLKVDNAKGISGLTDITVEWDGAIGPYYKYYLVHKEVDSFQEPDKLLPGEIETLISGAQPNVMEVNAGLTSEVVSSLESYKFYQFKLVVCTDVDCSQTNRLYSDLRAIQVAPDLAPFYGITSIDNPRTSQEIADKIIHLNFSAPLVSLGYMEELKLNCHTSTSDPTPEANCPWDIVTPSNINTFLNQDFGGLEEISIKYTGSNPFSSTNFCFSMTPVIGPTDPPDNFFKEMKQSSLVIKCITPEEKTPTLVEFPGKTIQCNTNQTNLTVTWPEPTAGLYSNFLVVWKQKDSSPFDMGLGIQAFESQTDNEVETNLYKYAVINKGTNFKEITDLAVGKSYHTAVIAVQIDGANSYRYGEINSRNSSCLIPVPNPKFNEWVEVVSLGPKVDGLVEPFDTVIDGDKYLNESLDNNGVPVETSSASSEVFDGVKGENDDQSSSEGMIRITWKDNLIYETEEFHSYFPETAASRSERRIGYRIYRSDDNRLTWKDLTAESGLIKAVPTTYFEKVGEESENSNLATFTDYSASYAKDGETFGSTYVTKTERARIFWYKVITVYKGQELEYEDEISNPQHMIRVLLPPPNMALVHRWIGNRTMCKEMNKPINKEAGGHYTCDYLGLGSSPKSQPWVVGQGVYDIGGDLLVDRFELGCNFTRGSGSGLAENKASLALIGPQKVGCTEASTHEYGTSNSSVTGPTSQNGSKSGAKDKELISGDCIGLRETGAINVKTSAGPGRGETAGGYVIPGILGLGANNSVPFDDPAYTIGIGDPTTDDAYRDLNTTETVNQVAQYDKFFNDHMAKSEFGAVYKMRSTATGWKFLPSYLTGKKITDLTGSTEIYERTPRKARINSCLMNLPYLAAGNNLKSRWLPVTHMGSDTFQDIKDNDLYYDSNAGSDVQFPGIVTGSKRIDLNMPVVRAIASNNAKLPPMDGMAPIDLHNICGTFEVEVGHESEGNFEVLRAAEQKRSMRRKEFIVSSAWGDRLNVDKIVNLEKGFKDVEGPITTNSKCNTYDSNLKPAGQDFTLAESSHYDSTYPSKPSEGDAYLMTGSSKIDGNKNSEDCVSKFGIQDLVGNFAELTSERLFCDSSTDHIVLGPIGAKDDSRYAKKIGQGHWFTTDVFAPWTLSQEETGRCSSIEVGAQRSIATVQNGRVRTLYENKVVNGEQTQVLADYIRKFKAFDQEAVEDLRSADGNYLDFGQTHFGGPINRMDRIAMVDRVRSHSAARGDDAINHDLKGEALSAYFNPVLGIPLECGESSTEFGCGTNQGVVAESTSFIIKSPATTEEPEQYIHIGNSENYSQGMADIHWNYSSRYAIGPDNDLRLTFDLYTNWLEPDKWDDEGSYLDGAFTLGRVEGGEFVEDPNDNDPPPAPNFAGRLYWTMERTSAPHDRIENAIDSYSRISFINGGDLRYKGSGRYSLFMQARTDQLMRFNGATPSSILSPQKGGRCVIKVKYDY